MEKPIPRREFLAAATAAAAAEYDSLMRAYEETLPRHPKLGDYLAAHPVEGVEVVDRQDGLGPRALDWPEGRPHPDVDAWVSEKEVAAAAEAQAMAVAEEEAARLAAEQDQAREEAAAALEAAAATVNAAVAAGKLDTKEVAEAYATIALAGVARLRRTE